MGEYYTLVYKKDFSNPQITELLNTIREKNLAFYTQLGLVFDKDEGAACREDVLKYFAEHAEQFREDTLYLYHIASLVENVKLAPEWFQWFNEYLSKSGGVSLDDFVIVMGEAVEKDIPLEETREIFEQGDSDILTIYEAIDQYQPVMLQTRSKMDHSDYQGVADETEPLMEETAMQEPIAEMSPEITKTEVKNNTDNYIDMFESLVKAMSIKGRSMDNEVLNVQDNLNKIIAKFQLTITELSAYSTEIIREWEKDKEENERMMALHNLQQKAIENQQKKINELRNENARLTSRIQDVSKSELRRVAINKKITELQSLASDQSGAITTYDWMDVIN